MSESSRRIQAAAGEAEAERPSAKLPLAPERLLQNWKNAGARLRIYLCCLGLTAAEREGVTGAAIERAVTEPLWPAGADAFGLTQRAMRRELLARHPAPTTAAGEDDAFLLWRLEGALRGRLPASGDAPSEAVRSDPPYLRSTPPLARVPMVPNRFARLGLRRSITRAGRHGQPDEPLLPGQTAAPSWQEVRERRRHLPWTGVAHRRRALLAVLVLIPSAIAAGFMLEVLPQQGGNPLEIAIAVFFGALFGWISIGFWTALFGFFLLVFGRDRFAITKSAAAADGTPLAPEARTAIVMPICEEPVDRVFAGLSTIHRSLERTGMLERFDFFILSDTSDPERWLREELAWFEWCRSVEGFARIFYRRRRTRVERKSGNVADFCRRWGRRYRYMIMLDADSVMTGAALVQLVRMMESNPKVGMIQTAPVAVRRRSLFGRVQQFAARLYGPMFTAGLHFWQLGDGQYWGHNAIIRVEPFMQHCALPRLPGKPPLGGEILSHDFVEAALMGRAGWELWLAYDLPGSYEEGSSSLLEEMKRDRRWCQGNLQHLRLVFTEGFFGAHRALFLNGALSYVSALLWFVFLSLSTAEAIWVALREPDYFPSGRSLFPEWPVWRPEWALALLATTAAILFLPKVLSLLLVLIKWRNVRAFGGPLRLAASVVLEVIASALFAPIRMVFHTRFVLTNLLGRTVGWGSSTREDAETGWAKAIRHHGLDTLIASLWGLGVHWLNPQYFWWLTPVVAALILSVPVSVYASRVGLGDRARRLGLFTNPEESEPPRELADLESEVQAAEKAGGPRPRAERDGFVRAVVDPHANAVHRALRGGPRSQAPAIYSRRRAVLASVLAHGPARLDAATRRTLLLDPELLTLLHRGVWELDSEAQAQAWGCSGDAAEGAVPGAPAE